MVTRVVVSMIACQTRRFGKMPHVKAVRLIKSLVQMAELASKLCVVSVKGCCVMAHVRLAICISELRMTERAVRQTNASAPR